MEQIIITMAADGRPESIAQGGRDWDVAAGPVRWFERTSWWDNRRRMPAGSGRVDIEVWQVQVRLGPNPLSALATMELVRDGTGDGWRLRSLALDSSPIVAA